MFSASPRFVPHATYKGGHLQTVMGACLPCGVPPVTNRLDLRRVWIDVGNGDRIEGWYRPALDGPTVFLAHGLGGSVDSPYIAQSVEVLVGAGFGLLAINHRGSGGLGERTTRPYMTGNTADLAAALSWLKGREPRSRVLAVGFSISGNTLLKYLGEGRAPSPDAAIAVAPPIDLDACSTDLLRPKSRAFDLWILRSCRRWIPHLRGEYRGSVKVRPWASLRAFDERYITPVWGFDSLDHYYRSASAIHVVDRIRIPTLVMHASDDPVVDVRHSKMAPWSVAVNVEVVEGGGHLGFIERAPEGGRSPWLPRAILHHARSFAGAFPVPNDPPVPMNQDRTPCAAP